MDDPKIRRWQKQLAAAQARLAALGPMRPGSLSQQYRDPVAKTGAYWQLSYTHTFTRLFTYVRAALWLRRDLAELLRRCGTAPGAGGTTAPPRQSELPGFAALLMGQHA